jgi:hypothetical protein
MNRKVVQRGLAAVGLVLLVAQLVPVDRVNPPVQGEVAAPAAVRAILRRACYDCHSNEVRWPWYGRVAPFSWLLERDVREGRKEVNFSVFEQYPEKRQRRKWTEIPEQIQKNEMPPWFYVAVHPDARLSESDSTELVRWAREAGAALGPREGAAAP